MRHGYPTLRCVEAARMQPDGHAFYLSENGVWLVNHVATSYITFPTA